MGFLQQFDLVIKYKKGIHNKVADMLSRPPINASIILQNSSLTHESYIEQYAEDKYFKKVYASLIHGKYEENYYVHNQLLYHLGKLCIPEKESACDSRST